MTTVSFYFPENRLDTYPSPVPASKALPEYFKGLPANVGGPADVTAKRCIPFLEAMSGGYILPLWADMHVVADKGNLKISFPPLYMEPQSLGSHSYKQLEGHPLSEQPYGKNLLKFMNPWIIQTEPGWSCMFVSPLNHFETRFQVLAGTVDTDTYYNNINFPFLWTGGDGEFMVPRGTPLVQVIPFRREQTELVVQEVDKVRKQEVQSKIGSVFKDAYRNFFWHKKQ